MSKLKCKCGNIISAVTNQSEGVLITSSDLSNDNFDLSEISRDILECPKCGRLAISYPNKHDWKVKFYVPENDKDSRLINRPAS